MNDPLGDGNCPLYGESAEDCPFLPDPTEAKTFGEMLAERDAEIERLRKMTAVSMGVGDGSGQLFVHGDHESIKMCQRKLLALEDATAALGRLRKQLAEITGVMVRAADDLAAIDAIRKARGGA